MIEELLSTGESQGQTAEELRKLTGLTESVIIQQINKERLEGVVILETLTNPTRYYLPGDTRSLYRYIWNLIDIIPALTNEAEAYKELISLAKKALSDRRHSCT